MAKLTKKAIKEMVSMYHEWRLLQKQVAEMEKTLKAWTDENGPLPISESDEYVGVEQVEESINVEVPAFEQLAPVLFGEQVDLLINKSAPKKNFEAVCALLAKRAGRSSKEVQAELWSSLDAAGCIKVTKKKVYRERTAEL
jgi:hypothetical protein